METAVGRRHAPGKRVILTVGTRLRDRQDVGRARAAARRAGGRRQGVVRADRPDRDDDRGLGRRGRPAHQRLRPGHRRVARRAGRGARRLGARRGPGLARPPGLLVGDARRSSTARRRRRWSWSTSPGSPSTTSTTCPRRRSRSRRCPAFIELHERVAGLVAPSKVVAVALNTSLYPDDDDARRDHRGDRRRDRAADRRPGPVRRRPAVGGRSATSVDALPWVARDEPAPDAGDAAPRPARPVPDRPVATTDRTIRASPRSSSSSATTAAPGVVGVGEGYPDRFYGETPETMAVVLPMLLEAVGEVRPDEAGLAAADLGDGGGHPRPRRGELRGRHRAARPRRQGRRRARPRAPRPLGGHPADRLHHRHRRARDRRRAGRPRRRLPGAQDQGAADPRTSRRWRRCAPSTAVRSGSTPTRAGRPTRRSRSCPSSSGSASS